MSHSWAFCQPPAPAMQRRCCGAPQPMYSQQPSRPAAALNARVQSKAAQKKTSRSGAVVRCAASATAAPLPGHSETAAFILGWPCDFPAHYMLGRHLGTGAYGVVNLVIERSSGRDYACKVLPKQRGRLTPEKLARKILTEVELLSRVQECSNVVRLHEVYEDAQHVFIIMENCKGGDLETLLEENGPLTERQAALAMHECLKVVAACHALGVVHGDVKPANFLLRQRVRDPLRFVEAGQVQDWLKAADFGCSQVLRGAQLHRRTGTPVYMAPEVFQREYGLEADMWSAGMMLYQLITCRFPFWDSIQACREKSLDEVARAVILDDILLNFGPWLEMSQEGLDFLNGLIERDPVQRMTAAEALKHPWFQLHLQQPPVEEHAANNIVPRGTHSIPAPAPAPARAASMPRVGRSYPLAAAQQHMALATAV